MAAPLSDKEFARRLDRFGPFESAPHLAVGVSGGADSLALTLFADRWARRRGGRITALTVDHGLRAASAEEAARIGAWLAARGIAHHVLRWNGPKPRVGIQAAARTARRDLLAAYCRVHGILHLLLGHQADDQAETVMMRVVAGSGPDGMAGMAAVVEQDDVRIIRPLLAVRHEQLVEALRAAQQEWIEDPSNRDARFARTRLRDLGSSPDEALAAARSWGRARIEHETQAAAFLARAAVIHPEGWAELELAALRAAPEDVARRALERALMTVGGLAYPPRSGRLTRLLAEVLGGNLAGGRTLGGCLVRSAKGRVRLLRELAAIAPDIAIGPPDRYLWDNRFVLRTCGQGTPETRVAALGEAGWAALVAVDKSLKSLAIPAAARVSLPALWDLDGVLEVYHLLYRRKGADPDSVRVVSAVFRPRHGLAGAGFAAFEPSPPSQGETRPTAADDQSSP